MTPSRQERFLLYYWFFKEFLTIYLYAQFWIEIESSKQYDRECGYTSYVIVVRTSSKASKLVPGPFNTLQLQPNISSLEYPEEAKI